MFIIMPVLYLRRQKTVNVMVTMRIRDMNCTGLLQVMKSDVCCMASQNEQSSVWKLLSHPRDILGRLPERKTGRVLWHDFSLRVLQSTRK